MSKKLLCTLLVAVMIVATALTGCGGTNDDSKSNTGEVVWNIKTNPKSWDPGKNANAEGGHISNNIFEGLMKDTEDGTLEPGVAESYELSDDETVYTFHLREDAKWSDGQPVTAHDFEYAWKRVCNADTAATYAFIMTPYIKGAQEYYDGTGSADDVGIKALDDYTLEVQLNFPVAYFLNLTSFYTYMPVRQDCVETGDGWEKDPETCISNGPFKLEEYKSDLHIILTNNEEYWNADSVKLDRIKAVMIKETTTAFQGYQSGEIQCLDAVPNEEIANLKSSDSNFTIKPRVKNLYFVANYDKNPTSDPNVRKALALAIDRTSLVEKVTKGGEIPATGIVPPTLTFSDGSSFRKLDEDGNPLPEYGIDPSKALVEEAQQLLADAGYPNGEGFPEIELLYNVDEQNQKIAEAVQEMWKENLNIDVTLRNEDFTTFRKTVFEGNYDLAINSWGGDYADPMTMLDIFTSYSDINNTQWRWQPYETQPNDTTMNPSNKDFDEYIKNAQSTSGTERDEWLRKAEQLLIGDEMICIPVLFPSLTLIIDESVVEGVYTTVMGQWMFDKAELVG